MTLTKATAEFRMKKNSWKYNSFKSDIEMHNQKINN